MQRGFGRVFPKLRFVCTRFIIFIPQSSECPGYLLKSNIVRICDKVYNSDYREGKAI